MAAVKANLQSPIHFPLQTVNADECTNVDPAGPGHGVAENVMIRTLRRMCDLDLDHVLELEKSLYTHPWTRSEFVKLLTGANECWVLECRGEVAAYALLKMGGHPPHLMNLSVAAAWQRQGFGRLLLEHLASLARQFRATEMLLEVRVSNAAAQRLYSNSGFVEITIRRAYYPAAVGREDGILMRLDLGKPPHPDQPTYSYPRHQNFGQHCNNAASFY